jgi:hypothetical protein
VKRSGQIAIRDGDASCTLWLEGCPSFEGLATACIGGLQCRDAASGRALLALASGELARRGFAYVVGPMERDTWHAHRLVTESDGSPPFALEPSSPPFHLQAFAGFDVIGRYSSARAVAPRRRNLAAFARRLQDARIRIRSFDPRRAEQDLLSIYRLSRRAFAGNFLYTPIGEGEFMDLYRPLLGRLDPELILMAQDDALQGFLFAIPDGHAVILKTYAGLRPGLGAFLAEYFQSGPAARYDTVIHALMHERNPSRRTSEKYAVTFRRYALFGRRL